MIKPIQLRGISTTPSDLTNQDGGCAESLNVYVDQNELAVTRPPVPVETAGSFAYPVLYIHRIRSIENHIAVNGTSVLCYTAGGLDLNQNIDDYPQDFAHVGNTLLVRGEDHLHFFMFKEGHYRYLGYRIYEPLMNFSVEPVGSDGDDIEQVAYISAEDMNSLSTSSDAVALQAVLYNGTSAGRETPLTAARWQKILKNRDAQSGLYQIAADPKGGDLAYQIESRVWERVAKMIHANRAQGVFSRPVLARAAVKLYDGSYIYHTEPFLMGQGNNQWLDVWRLGHAHDDGTDDTVPGVSAVYTRIKITLEELFRAKYSIRCNMAELSQWEDIIQGVDIFLSTDICNPHESSELAGVHIPVDDYSFHFYFEGQDGMGNPKDIKDEILSKGNFYKVASIPFSQLTAAMEENLEPVSQDDLLIESTLPLDTLSHHESRPLGPMTVYNERVIYSGLGQDIYAGSPAVQSAIDDGSVTHTYRTKYYLHTPAGDIATNGRTITENSLFGAFLFYPDPRCYQVDIQKDGITYRIPMEDHPSLNGSYALVSLDKSILTAGTVVAGDFTYQPRMDDVAKLVMSEVDNPFLLPNTGRLTFDSKVIKVCTTTEAVSTNSTGMMPFYIFTESGIWAVEINKDGTIGSQPQAVSRDVALSVDSITPVDRGVIFTTAKGVMQLQGSSVSNLSANMHGYGFKLTEEQINWISTAEGNAFSSVLGDHTAFLAFMEHASAMYDYKGDRILYVSPDMPQYQYMLKLSSGTWHRISNMDGKVIIKVLNSYPDARATVYDGSVYKLYDFGHAASTDDTTLYPAVIITRSLDFDAPFIRKTITHMKARLFRAPGSQASVKVSVLASNDDTVFYALRSLRGLSFKFYRFVIQVSMTPQDRLSWLDVDVEPRLRNKLR